MNKTQAQWLLINLKNIDSDNITLKPEVLTSPMFFETMLWTGNKFPLLMFHIERIQKICSVLHLKWEHIETSIQTLLSLMQQYFHKKPKKVNLYFFPLHVYPNQPLFTKISDLNSTPISHLRYVPKLYTFSSYFFGLKSIQCQVYLSWRDQYCRLPNEDLILLSPTGKVSETTIANLWWSDGKRVYTPSLAENCVNGVGRKALLSFLKSSGCSVLEKSFTLANLQEVKMIWLTNALRGVQMISHILNDNTILWKQEMIHNEIHQLLGQFHHTYFNSEIS